MQGKFAFYDIVQGIVTSKGITLKQLEEDLGLAKHHTNKWKKSLPSYKSLIKLADYLDVSIDTLLGRENGLPTKAEEAVLIDYFRKLNQEHRDDLIKMALNFYVIEGMYTPVKKETAIS